MYKRVFVDANIILDIFDNKRVFYQASMKFYEYALLNKIELFTSCDIVTTVYYVDSKNGKDSALTKIEDINHILKVIEFSNYEVMQTCKLMKEDKNYCDLEDTIQYILAKKKRCDLILSNDKNFYASDIEVLSSEEFLNNLN
ncbi:MAG: PIN domain-containing protein [Epsilonproteobacteria bacterium]|nr:PIN domain-containing protein [Campylobacterota bacterium]